MANKDSVTRRVGFIPPSWWDESHPTRLAAILCLAALAAAPTTKPSDREARLANRRDARVNEEAAELFRTADTTFLVGDLNRASDLFAKVIAAHPASSFTIRAHARMGDCAFEAKRYIDAAAHYRRAATAADSASVDEETAAGVRADFMAGQCYLQAKLYAQAFGQFRKFIDRHPGHALVNNAYRAIGDAHLAMEQHQQALRAYRMVGTVIGEKTQAHRRIAPGQRLYLRVTDADVNVGDTPRTVTATIKTSGGDVETVELDPPGPRSPFFLATIPTALGEPRHSGKLEKVFSESAATRIREQLTEADTLDRTGRDKAEEAIEVDRSTSRLVNPAGAETKRAALTAESEQLLAKSKTIKADACKTIDAAFAEYEKLIAAWAPEQALSAIPGTQPATAPATPAASGPAEGFIAAAKPFAGVDEDEPAATPPSAADAERRGMTENDVLQVRLSAAQSPTTLANIDARLTTLSVWSRLLQRQFQRLELSGGDRIEIEYFDEVGPNGPNAAGKAIRKDVVEVASDAAIDLLSFDGREPLPQVVVNSKVLLRVIDPDADLSASPDSVTVVLAAVPLKTPNPADADVPSPTTQRATPGELVDAGAAAARLPLVPPGAASMQVKLIETGPRTGIFEKLISVTPKGVIEGASPPMLLQSGSSEAALHSLRMAYEDARAVRNADGWVLAKTIDCLPDTGGEVSAVKYRQTPLDLEAKLRRAVAAGEVGKIYLDLGLTRRGREALASAQADCDEVARAGLKSKLGEDALHHSWRIYFYAGLLDEAVTACRTLMQRYPDSDYIDDAIFAMGQASLERGEKLIEQDAAAGAKPTLNRDLARAVSQFEDLLKRFPASPMSPEALFMIARAKMAAGQTGLDIFERLAKQYPDSVHAARGLIKSAEYYASINDHRRALEYYGRVLVDYPDSPNLGEVLLQRGLCQYKLGQHAEALQTFYRVVEEHSASDLAQQAQKHIGFINQKRGGNHE